MAAAADNRFRLSSMCAAVVTLAVAMMHLG